ncbi:MAG: RHS repeat-associated core domain-containing protein, partial [Rhodanobacteraceae bacterium]
AIFDDYGNVIETTSKTAKGLTTKITTPTLNDTANWHLGLVQQREVVTIEAAKNALPVLRTTAFTYTSKGEIETIVVEPNHPDPAIPAITSFAYDDYGLVSSITTSVANETPRTQHVDYTNLWPGAPDEHLYAGTAWADHDDPLCNGDCRPAAWTLRHPAYGVAVATMDRLGAETVQTYDGHGRVVGTESEGELPVAVTYDGRPDAHGGMNGLQVIASSGLQQSLHTFNARGAPLRLSFTGFDGQWVNRFSTYDSIGRLTGVSRPVAGVPAAWTHYDHDTLGRTVGTTYPDGSSESTVFGLLQREHTDAAGHYSYQNYDVDGRLITSGSQLPPAPGCGVCLAQDIKTTFQYSATPTGAVATAFDDQGHATKTQYDRRGRAVMQEEPSRGVTTASYNGFGERKQTVHVANGDTETHTYDDLGRRVTTTTADGLTTYTWDLAANGLGRLARAMSPDQIRTEYRYDTLGRTIGIDQTDEQNRAASLDLAYDVQTGQLAQIDYPKAPGQAARLRIAYDYNGYGYLRTVRTATPNQPSLVLQEILARNADLSLVDAVRGIDPGGLGGGAINDHREYDPLMGRLWSISALHAGANRLDVDYNYDAEGLVSQRTSTDERVQIDEMFEHDALHRLTHTTRNGMPLNNGLPFSMSIDETYDSVGNRIDTSRNGQLLEHRSYGSNGQKPYALTQRTVSDPAQPNLPPQSLSYQYDALGRLAQDDHRAFSWTALDLPRSVTRDGQTSTFRYDAGGERAKKSGANGTTTYLGGWYEKRDDGHAVQHVYHVVGDESVADITYNEAANPTLPGTTSVTYPLTDALGSTLAVADEKGTVLENDYYDAWGLRSNPDGTPLANLPLFQGFSSAGFTNHEHDDALGLINMKGRLYDPVLGRFLSPDPIVGSPGSTQRWNAYSYVVNSPVNFTDPSGFDPEPSANLIYMDAPGNEIKGTLEVAYGGETFGGTIPGGGGFSIDAAGSATALINGLSGFMREGQQRVEPTNDRRAAFKRSPDGTAIANNDAHSTHRPTESS